MDSEDARKQSLGELHERRKQDPALSESRKVMTRELTWPPRPILAEYLAKRLPWSQRHRSARRPPSLAAANMRNVKQTCVPNAD